MATWLVEKNERDICSGKRQAVARGGDGALVGAGCSLRYRGASLIKNSTLP